MPFVLCCSTDFCFANMPPVPCGSSGSFWAEAFYSIMADVRAGVNQSSMFMTEGIVEEVSGAGKITAPLFRALFVSENAAFLLRSRCLSCPRTLPFCCASAAFLG